MANVISGLDSAWAFPTAAGLSTFKAQGGQVVFGYLSNDPSKDWTPDRLRMVHHLGLGAGMNFESYANRALEGNAAGFTDGMHAWDEITALIRMVGYAPKSHLHVYSSADFDAQPAQYPAIDAYLRGFAQGMLAKHANADTGVYGSYALVVHTALVGTSRAEWQTYAWSGGRFYTGSEYYQWSNGHNAFGGSVDYDQVIDPANLGAWWPPGSQYDSPPAPTRPPASNPGPVPAPVSKTRKVPSMIVCRVEPTTIPAGASNPGWFTFDGSQVRHLHAAEGNTNNGSGVLAGLGQTNPVTVTFSQYLEWKAGT